MDVVNPKLSLNPASITSILGSEGRNTMEVYMGKLHSFSWQKRFLNIEDHFC